MAADVTIPRLGWSMEEGVFAGWLKSPGDEVKPGQPLFMLEGEKATQEIEAVDGGLLHLAPDAPAAGQTVLVGRVIAKLCAAGESPDWSAVASPPAGSPPPAPPRPMPPPSPPIAAARPPVSPAVPAAGRVSHGHAGPAPQAAAPAKPGAIPAAASPTVRRMARQLGIDLATVSPHLPGGRLTVADLAVGRAGHAAAAPVPSGPVRSSPRARRAARERGIDLASIRGGGAGGRIRERDVLDAAGTAPSRGAAAVATGSVPPGSVPPGSVPPGSVPPGSVPPGSVPPGSVPPGSVIPITATRRTIARQMVRSRTETVPVTLTAWADATAILAARAALKAEQAAEAPTLNDMLLKILAGTLLAHPLLAARWEESQLVLPGDRIDVGLAVDAPGGLVVPVVRDVAASTLSDVARQTRWLVERARAGRLVAADMQGGVFTLTSLGSYGIEFFTPVINHPEAAILGVGAIRMQPVPPAGGQEGFILQRQLPLSLTFDHRIVDGGPAARFVGDLAGRIAAFDPAVIRH